MDRLANLLAADILSPIDVEFAQRMGKNKEEQLFLAFLFKSSREGHLCFSTDEISDSVLREEVEKGQATSDFVVHEKGLWYFTRNFIGEKKVMVQLARLKSKEPGRPLRLSASQLSTEQGKCFDIIEKQTVTFVCGGPGTGKTHLASTLIEACLDQEVVVAAPTGKAAQGIRNRLSSQSHRLTIGTLHSILKVYHPFPQIPYLTADLVVVDEGSMIDARLFAHLLTAVKTGARLVILGDPDQLPPVSSGNLFADLAKREGVFLKTCHRTELHEIILLAKLIKEGKSEQVLPFVKKYPQVLDFQPIPKKEILAKKVKCPTSIEEAFEAFERTRYLTPLRRGPYGVSALSRQIPRQGIIPILIRENEPQMDFYNGDFGLIEGDRAYFLGKEPLPLVLLPSYEEAYFLSVHKSQGSEYDEVHVLLPEGSELFGREMLYTAVTRARKRVVLYGEEGLIKKIISQKTGRLSGINDSPYAKSVTQTSLNARKTGF
ncbi:MAG: AAA family ATPase [Chlamydiia bacterium]|nr:AAA family ATPase [Chlamydiia bacterium]